MKTYEESDMLNHSDAEITLGMRSILGIFIGLVLVCGVFFGFGYSLGRGDTGNEPASAETILHPLRTARASAVKVKTVIDGSSASTSALPAPPAYAVRNDASSDPAGSAPEAAKALPQPKPSAVSRMPDRTQPVTENANTYAGVPVGDSSSGGHTAPGKTAAAANPAQPAAAPAAIMVQIAAVSHREDADVLVTALSKLGYSASVRPESTDALLHVQIGPFATRDEAKAMRTKLLNDGYNAILK